MASTQITNPNRQHNCTRRRQQDNHCQKNEIHGYAPVVAPLSRITRPIPLLLGPRTEQSRRLLIQGPPRYILRIPASHPRWLNPSLHTLYHSLCSLQGCVSHLLWGPIFAPPAGSLFPVTHQCPTLFPVRTTHYFGHVLPVRARAHTHHAAGPIASR